MFFKFFWNLFDIEKQQPLSDSSVDLMEARLPGFGVAASAPKALRAAEPHGTASRGRGVVARPM